MSEKTSIEWTDSTFSPWHGCSKVSAGCAHCYAEGMGNRFGVAWGKGAPRKLMSDAYWDKPRTWDKHAQRLGRRLRVFCGSMCDWADDEAPAGAQARLWRLIRDCPWIDWQMLTKRPENIPDLLPEDWGDGWDHVQIGVSAEDQATADRRIPVLMDIPARVRFLSCEPLLGPIDLSRVSHLNPAYFRVQGVTGALPNRSEPDDYVYHEQRARAISWVICGGESNHGARPMHPDWARSLRDQCANARIPFFFKQWGEWLPMDQVIQGPGARRGPVHKWPGGLVSVKVGKHAAGRLLDGVEHRAFPDLA